MKRWKRATAVDLFCGCGGLTEGLKQAGFRVLGAVDVNPLAVLSYRCNHPETKTFDQDICTLASSKLLRVLGLQVGQLDLLAGCPPCQGFSSLRTLNGGREVDDSRNDLIFEFLRLVCDLRPKAVMLENVPALASDRRLREFKEQLRKLGYVPRVRISNVAHCDVPQRRVRMIMLAGLGGRIQFGAPSNHRVTVGQRIAHLPRAGESGDPLHDIPEKRSERIMEFIQRIPHNGGSRIDAGEAYQLDCHRRLRGFRDVYGRISMDDLAPTITSGCFNPSKGRFLHPTEDRAITLREAALLQGFPRAYHLSLKHGETGAASLIGNALPPEFVRRHAVCVRAFITSVKRKAH